MFSENEQTNKTLFPSHDSEGSRTRKHCFRVMFPEVKKKDLATLGERLKLSIAQGFSTANGLVFEMQALLISSRSESLPRTYRS